MTCIFNSFGKTSNPDLDPELKKDNDMKTTSFHKSNFGRFGENLPSDLDGYVHITITGWMSAPLDGLAWSGYTAAQKREQCKEMAAEAREAVKAASEGLANWRKAN